MNINIKTFDTWAINNRDESMAAGHYPSVMAMLDLIKKHSFIMNKPFSFIDLGCGNGWVIREILKDNNCTKGFGIDGSKNMIKKLKNITWGYLNNMILKIVNLQKNLILYLVWRPFITSIILKWLLRTFTIMH